MIITYSECKEKFKSPFLIKKALQEGKLFQLEKGLYSDKKYNSTLAIISKKYPNAIFTLNSAFYYHNLTDIIPEKFYLSTEKNAAKISDTRVIQKYENSNLLHSGVINMEYNGCQIKIYNKERLLIELLRNKNKLSYDLYKKVVNNYRNIIYNLNIQEIQEYAEIVPKSKLIQKALQEEVL